VTTKTRFSLFAVGMAVVALLASTVSPADAIGTALGKAGNGYHCGEQYNSFTLVQESSDAPTAYIASGNGTLDSWTIQGAAIATGGSGEFRLAVWRPATLGSYSLVYKSPQQTVSADGVNHTFTLAPPVAVQTGDHLGLIGVYTGVGPDPDCTRFTTGTNDNVGVVFGDGPPGAGEPVANDIVAFSDYDTYVGQSGKVQLNVEANFIAAPTGPTYSIADTSVNEGNGGYNTPKKATFTITRTGDTTGSATVHFRTESGTSDPRAIKDTDFKSRDTVLTFLAGQSQVTVDVTINGDTIPEANERFRGIIDQAPVGTTITRSVALGTINDDDGILVN
jgi:hypothetical protein